MEPCNHPAALPGHREMILRSLEACDRSTELLRRTTQLLYQSRQIHQSTTLRRQHDASRQFLILHRLHPQFRDYFNQSGFDFLMVDLETGIAFATRAAQTHIDPETRIRNAKNARKAYDLVTRLRKRLFLSSDQDERLAEKHLKLGKALESLGE